MREQALGVCIFLLCGAGLLAYLYEPPALPPPGSSSTMAVPASEIPPLPSGGPSAVHPPSPSSPPDTLSLSNLTSTRSATALTINPPPGTAAPSPATPPARISASTTTSNQTASTAQAATPTPPESVPAQALEEPPPALNSKPDATALAPIFNTGSTDGKRIAITFDDGPHASLTYRILDELRTHHIKTTFFVIGNNAKRYPWVLQQIVAEGHEIGNHTYSHRILSQLSNEKVEEEIKRCQEIVKETTGCEPSLFRPPYGNYRTNTREIARQFRLNIILWSVDPRDWRIHDDERIYQEVIRHVRPGSIILCHDNHPATIKALPRIFDTLTTDGYQFVTVSELCGLTSTAAKPADTVSSQ